MNRLHLAAVCLSSALAVGCGPKEFGSLCDTVPAPAECMTACDPTPLAVNTCPGGFHCSPDGKCDAQCTATGGQCGDGYRCTEDGHCVDDSGPPTNGPDANCPAVNFTPMPTTPSITLVLDRSGSMDATDISPTRYLAMKDALTGTNGVVTQLESKAYFGAVIYGCSNNAYSPARVPRALNNNTAIRNAFPQSPSGGTPTPDAINDAVAGYTQSPPPMGSPPIIVLATDGLPNSCNGGDSQTQSVAAARAAYQAGIPVYVLAINQNSQHFQDVANAGQGWQAGQPNVTYYPVTNAAGLQAAFQTIINGVISCDLTLTSSIDAAQAMNGTVTVNGVQLTYGSDWILVNGNIIRVQGQACTNLKNSMNPMVQATFPCGSVIL